MPEDNRSRIHWDFYALLLLAACAVVQAVRWPMFPQFMDTFYHLHTAWGFQQAGGYVNWDFWQYAPVGRPHIYPPFFHVLLALLLNSGIPQIVLAKILEIVLPVAALVLTWRFCRRQWGDAFAFWAVLAFVSSFGFFSSLANHLPSTLALIFGLLAMERLWKHDAVRSACLLAAAFYTHIGMAWFWVLAMIFWAATERRSRRHALMAVALAMALSLPVLITQAAVAQHISRLGYKLNETLAIQVKPLNYLLAVPGVFLAIRRQEYRFFLCLLVASLVFLAYPFRLVTAEGFFAVLLLDAVALHAGWQRLRTGRVRTAAGIGAVVCLLVVSPTIAGKPQFRRTHTVWQLEWCDSAIVSTLFAKGQRLWVPEQYIPAEKLIRQHSRPGEIVVSSLDMFGVILAGLSGRPAANALLPEVKAVRSFDSIAASRLVVIPKDEEPALVAQVRDVYRLEPVGETDFFVFLRNPAAQERMSVPRPTAGWPVVFLCIGVWLLLMSLSISLEFSGE